MSGPRSVFVRERTLLAVEGGQPAFSNPLHVGQPNMPGRHQFMALVGEMFERNWFTNDGELVHRFERAVADQVGTRHCVAICNGTTALEIAVAAAGLHGEVIVPSYTFVATVQALRWSGGTPVFADIHPRTHNLDPDSVRSRVTERTTGILAVHLWGRPAPVLELEEIAREHGLRLLFDAAHAFGCATADGQIGSFGDAEVFSFHATKFLNSFEGGAIVTDDDGLAERARLMRNFGFAGYDNVVSLGTNGKMTEVCAAMGVANLAFLEDVIAANQDAYRLYEKFLGPLPGLRLLPLEAAHARNYQYVVVEVGPECAVTRDELVATLHAENVLARRYFWPGVHRMHPFSDLEPEGGWDLPHTEQVANRVVVMPTGPALTPDDVEAICAVVRRRVGHD